MILPKRFIVVDDNRTNNIICEYAIRKWNKGVAVHLFTEPERALQSIQQEYVEAPVDGPTVLFLDINMPTITGWEFLDHFRLFEAKVHEQFVIYILTSSVDERDKEKADSDPLVAGFISKPLTHTTVQQAVEGMQRPRSI